MKGYSDGALSAAKDLAEIDVQEFDHFKDSEKIQKDLGRISQKISDSSYKSKEEDATLQNSSAQDASETYSVKLSRDIASADYASEFANDDVVYEEKNNYGSIPGAEDENYAIEEINE